MTTQRDSTKPADDTQLRIVAHRLEVSGSAASRAGDSRVRAGNGSHQTETARHVLPETRLPQIVLVDRDVDALREVAISLREHFDFHVTISGNEALNLLQNGVIDAIVVGQTLYSSTGLNVLAEARKRAPNTQRVLLANAVEASGIERDAVKAHPFRILERPCTPQKLLELLDSNEESHDGGVVDSPVDSKANPISGSVQARSTIHSEPADEHVEHLSELRQKAHPHSIDRPADIKTQAASRTTSQNIPRSSGATSSPRVAPVYHGDYEHVVLETPPELPRRRTKRTSITNEAGVTLTVENLPLVVYTDNGEFYQKVCTALQDRHEIRLATQIERAIEMAEMGSCPVLITDRAGTQTELQKITIALRASEPALVTIACGTVNEGLALRKLLNTPALYGFLPKPLSAPLLKLTVEAAKRHYIETKRPAQISDATSLETVKPAPAMRPTLQSQFRPMQAFEQNFDIEDRFDYRKLIPYAWIAGFLLIAAGGVGWYWHAQSKQDAEVAVLLEAELDLARRAYAAGDFVTPENANALYFYQRVLKRDATNAEALHGIDNVAERVVEATEKQLTEDKIDAAAKSIAVLRELKPTHKRLAFLEGQVNKSKSYRLSQKLAEQNAETARAEAAKANAAARLLETRPGDDSSTGLIGNSVQRAQAVNRWLSAGRQRLSRGLLVVPETDSAEYFFRLAERADPNNPAVDQGLRDIGTRLLNEAQDAVTRQQLDVARKKLTDASRFGPDPSAVAKLREQIDQAANSGVRNNFLRLALLRTRENALFEPAQDNAKYYLSQLQRLDSSSNEVKEASRAIATKLIDNANQATAQRQFNIAIRLLDEARRLGFSGPELTDADARLQSARNPPSSVPSINPQATAPKVIKSVAAKFPDEAMEAGVSGWVDVQFKINAAGDVYDASAILSNPPGPFAAKFEKAAVAAISQYKFERRPISDTQTQSMVVRVQFKLK